MILKTVQQACKPEGKRTCKIGAHARGARAKKATVFVKKQFAETPGEFAR